MRISSILEGPEAALGVDSFRKSINSAHRSVNQASNRVVLESTPKGPSRNERHMCWQRLPCGRSSITRCLTCCTENTAGTTSRNDSPLTMRKRSSHSGWLADEDSSSLNAPSVCSVERVASAIVVRCKQRTLDTSQRKPSAAHCSASEL